MSSKRPEILLRWFLCLRDVEASKLFLATNDIIKASEYAKTGFFYLDEAVDLNQNIPLIRYLRAKVDAYLPAELGRCVITLEDTDILLKQELSSRIRDNVNDMRYRAFYNCKLYQQAGQLLSILQVDNPNKKLIWLITVHLPGNLMKLRKLLYPL